MSQQNSPEESGADSLPRNDGPEASATGASEEAAIAVDGPGEQAEVVVPGRDSAAAARKGPYEASTVAVLLAFCAAAAAAFLWWQYRQFYVVQERADADVALSVQGVRDDQRSLEDRLEMLEERNEQAGALVAELGGRLDTLPGRFAELERRLTAVQGVSEDARRRWLRAEAEYYLTVANAELSLAGRWENAVSALELADAKLRELANPGLGGVRERIEQELQQLRGARLPDVEGLSYSLGRLASRVAELPVRAAAPTSYPSAREAVEEDSEPGLARVWLSLKGALAGMISVERRDEPGTGLRSVDEQVLVRRRLELELEMARLGLLRGQTEVFQVSLGAARTLLEHDFQSADASVEGAIALVEDMMGLDIDPLRPDISGSLNLLRSAPDRED